MRFYSTQHLALLTSLFGALVQCIPLETLEERGSSGSCNADNLLRLLRGDQNLLEALVYCHSYLSRVNPTETSTITEKSTTVIESTSTSVETSITTSVLSETSTSSLTVTVTETHQGIDKRNAKKKPLAESLASGTYPPSRISSACNCLTIPVSTITTAITTTIPETLTSVITESTSTTLVITQTVSTDIFVTATSTETVTSVTTVTPPPQALDFSNFRLRFQLPGQTTIDPRHGTIVHDNYVVIWFSSANTPGRSPIFSFRTGENLYLMHFGNDFPNSRAALPWVGAVKGTPGTVRKFAFGVPNSSWVAAESMIPPAWDVDALGGLTAAGWGFALCDVAGNGDMKQLFATQSSDLSQSPGCQPILKLWAVPV